MKHLWHYHRHRKLLKHIATFYTYWALGFHILYWLDLVPNTFVIAMIVLVVSQIMFWIWPGHVYQHRHKMGWIINELLAHWGPFILFVGLEHTSIGKHELIFAIITILIYVLVHGYRNIYRYYTRMGETVSHIRNN